MNLQEIFDNWKIDSEINITNLAETGVNLPKIHEKYLRQYSYESLRLSKMTIEYDVLRKKLSEYYGGKADDILISELKKEPNKIKILKGDIPQYINSDDLYVEFSLKLSIQKQKVEALENIVKTINNRGFLLKTLVDYERFKSGN